MSYVCEHKVVCEHCGQEYSLPPPVIAVATCNHRFAGVCDARGRSHSLHAIADAMSEVEMHDMCVGLIVMAGRLAPEVREAMDQDPDGLKIWGAKVQFEGAVMVWDEERIAYVGPVGT